jgi:ribosomal-protein-alanine N-acetyltransferase
MRIAGPTLELRPPAAADAPALLALGRDPEVTRWFSWGPYRTLQEPLAYIEDQAGRRERGEQLDLVAVHPEHGPVGITGLSEPHARDRRAVVGSWLGRPYWGTGLNAEAKALVFHLAFRHLGLERLGAYADVRHARSQRALEKVGFRREGVLRGFHRHGADAKDVVVYGLLREDWLALPAAAVPARLEGDVPAAWRALSSGAPPTRTPGRRAPRRAPSTGR